MDYNRPSGRVFGGCEYCLDTGRLCNRRDRAAESQILEPHAAGRRQLDFDVFIEGVTDHQAVVADASTEAGFEFDT